MTTYFDEQIKNIKALTEETINEMRQNRLDNNYSTESIDHYKPGDKQLFVLIQKADTENPKPDRLIVDLTKILESEIEDFEKAHTFINYAPKHHIPRFSVK